MKIEALHKHFLKSSGICTDTREISENCLFFALKGANFNGNKFAQQAINNGAYKAIIDESKYQNNKNETILVSDTLNTLQKLASYHREYLKLPIIALTGSNGKTTTKELVHAILSQKFITVATKGNLNNHIGVPLTILSMNAETEIGIVEMGANHLKEIEMLCEIAKPDYGYITNFGKAHLEGFGNLKGVIKAKTELYSFLKKNNKTAFVNANDKEQVKQAKGIKKVTFGNKGQDYNIKLVNFKDTVIVSYNKLEIKSNLIGLYNYSNISAAICIGSYFNVSQKNIQKAITKYIPTNNRSQLIKKGNNTIILDAYNANPSSMMAALENFKQVKANSKILFLGDMLELGAETEPEHQDIVNFIEANLFTECYLIGENFFKTKIKSTQVYRFNNYEDFQKKLQNNLPTNCHILIKASRGIALERILDVL